MIARIDSHELQTPGGAGTKIYGDKRSVTIQQFRPRGHYTETEELSCFFRCMMWLGRADCGWTICTDNPDSLSQSQSQREMRNAVLLTELLSDSGSLGRLQQLEQTWSSWWKKRQLRCFQLSNLLKAAGVRTASQLIRSDVAQTLQAAIAADRSPRKRFARK